MYHMGYHLVTDLVSTQYAMEEELRNSSRRNEEAKPTWKQCPAVDVMEVKSSAVKNDIA